MNPGTGASVTMTAGGKHAAAWPAPRRWRALAALLLGMLLLGTLLLAACAPTEGEDGSFNPLITNNDDFQKPYTLQVGNLPVSMNLVCGNAAVPDFACAPANVLYLVATADNLAEIPVLPGVGLNDTGTVTILSNDGAGNFTRLQTLTTEAFPTQAVWADLDGGVNDLDLVVVDSSNTRVAIYLSDGAGSWPATPSAVFNSTHTIVQMSVVDLANAGTADDVVYTAPGGEDIVALVNDGAGNFTERRTVAATGLTRFVAEDLDGDANLDLAILQPNGDRLEFWEWDGVSAFAQSLTTASVQLTANVSYIAAGDFRDGATNTDIAVLSETGTETNFLAVVRNNPAGTFTVSKQLAVLERAHHLFVVDVISGTPEVDLVIMHTNQTYITFEGGPLGDSSPSFLTTSRDPIQATYGSVTADAFNDIITVEKERRGVGILAGDNTGNFSRSQIGFTTELTHPRVVNVDGVNKPDLLLLQPNSDRVAVLLNVNP